MIVKKCGGVPLAIKALESLMSFKSHESEWLAIKESEIWHLGVDENCILPALRLSYDNLMPHMIQCFAYCCIFPKDHKMEENQLVQLWMANGFVPYEGQTDLHLAGHLIFKELVWRSFLQDVKTNFNGEMTCKMHDLMHDLALSVMRHETYILELRKVPKFPKMLHHLGLHLQPSEAIPENERKLKLPMDDSLHSLIVHESGTQLDIESFHSLLCTPPGLGDLTCLRQLSIFIVGQDASHQINQLKELNLGGKLSIKGLENVRNLEDAKSANLMAKRNLTYLSLYWKDINEDSAEEVLEGLQPHENLEMMRISSYQAALLENMSSLTSLTFQDCKKLNPLSGRPLRSGAVLEHLIIVGCPELKDFPESVQKLICLRVLRICECEGLRSLPDWLSRCPNLEKRCEKPNGENWLAISHIPFICIDRDIVQDLDI
ncbi:hypothetical protein BUALT_Bualt18G0061000 [Buddleja alternifolia]|uniref:NB-ARC domain-containing protein n=1 Tax=Buddleja alternifolia TaxID=168488 RepID=A0AAV6W4U9_9LAMI|nr:hypothetical protein BUALT_Bualt18G0061000 [Buddleja alternifolia]